MATPLGNVTKFMVILLDINRDKSLEIYTSIKSQHHPTITKQQINLLDILIKTLILTNVNNWWAYLLIILTATIKTQIIRTVHLLHIQQVYVYLFPRILISLLWNFALYSGASRHTIRMPMPSSLRSIQNSTAALPNKTSIPVYLCGDITLSDHLLKDILFDPRFQVNLLSASALIATSLLKICLIIFSFRTLITSTWLARWKMLRSLHSWYGQPIHATYGRFLTNKKSLSLY